MSTRDADREGLVRCSAWLGVYARYMKSAQWKNIRATMLKLSQGKCARCGGGSPNMEVHHKTYDRLGKERMDDLEVLCRTCHRIADAERAERGRQKSARALADARYSGALNGYMTKKYGEDWEMGNHDSTEFDEWIERKQYEDA